MFAHLISRWQSLTLSTILRRSPQDSEISYAKIPVYRLSADLLSDIFLIGLYDEIAKDGSKLLWEDGVGRPPTFPIAVASVCSNWRQVALDTGRLWSIIRLAGPGVLLGQPKLSAVASMYTWIDRSGDALLDIRIAVGQAQDEVQSSESVKFANAIFEHHISRCRHLRLCVHDVQTLSNTVNVLKMSSLINVKEFEISAVNPNRPQIAAGYGRTMLHGLWPSLQHLRRLHVRKMDSAVILDEAFMDYLAACESLKELSIDHVLHEDHHLGQGILGGNWGPPLDYPVVRGGLATTVIMHQLDTLLLIAVELRWVTAFLTRLSAPNLRSLVTTDFFGREMTVVEVLAPLDLSRLEIFRWYAGPCHHDVTSEDLARFLGRMPSLRSLDVGEPSGPADKVLDALLRDARADGVQVLCPRLSSLRIYKARPRRAENHEAREIMQNVEAIRLGRHATSAAYLGSSADLATSANVEPAALFGPFVDLAELLRLRRSSIALSPILHLSLTPIYLAHKARHIDRLRGLVDCLVVQDYRPEIRD